MTNPFLWRDAQSQLSEALKPPKKTKRGESVRLTGSMPPHGGAYSRASVSDETRERQIEQTNKEVEYHFAMAQKVTDEVMRGFHRDEARRLAAKVRALVLGRSADFVAKLEESRGLA